MSIKDVKNFYCYDFDTFEFKATSEVKNLLPELHAFSIPSNFNYKKFSKL